MENIRLLLVDDEEDFRNIIARRLKKRGLSAEQAGNGEECLAMLEKNQADVVILDVKMPGMDGLEVLHHIKKKYQKTEVILLTAHSSTPDGVEGIKAGAFDYLTKPVELEHLLEKIKQAYEKIQRLEDKEKEAEFREKMEQQMIVTERLASLGTLATGVAHEINNPLAIIKEATGWMELLLKKEELAEMPRKADFEKGLGKIEKSVERARRITHQLLDFVQKHDSALSEINLEELVEESVRLINREVVNKDIEIVRKTKPSAGNIWTDPYRLRQVLINLLNNAIHATSPGGKITISSSVLSHFQAPACLRSQASPAREQRKNNSTEAVELRVEDTGQGIPKENLKKIFEPFFSTKSPGKGTGLGLFVSQGIINKLGGNIEVESEVGKGTVFCITLPRYHKTEEEPEKNSRPDFWKNLVYKIFYNPYAEAC